MKRNILFLLALLARNCSIAQGMDIYFSPDGSDFQSGQADQPLKSLAAAQQKARALKADGSTADPKQTSGTVGIAFLFSFAGPPM